MFLQAADAFTLLIPPWPEYRGCDYRKFGADEKHITRYSQQFVLLFLQRNTLRFRENGADVSVKPGEWYIQLPGLRQEGPVPSPNAEYFYIHFDATAVPSQCGGGTLFPPAKLRETGALGLPVRGRYDIGAFDPVFRRLYALRIEADGALAQQAAFMEILSMLTVGVYSPQTKNALLAAQMQKFLRLHLSEELDAPSLTRQFAYSPNYLLRIFKDEYGVSPSQYLKRIRIDKAKDLLAHTGKTVAEVAEEIGYRDESVFYRAFKQQAGLSPGNWRKIHRFR